MAQLIIALGQLVVVSALALSMLWYFYSEARSIVAGAPFSPMPDAMIAPILSMVRLGEDDVFVDMGCGDGRVLQAAADSGAGRVVGYEIAGWPYMLARRRLRPLGARAKLVRADARTAQLDSATVVYLYLGAKIVDALAGKFVRELRSDTKILSPLYPINTTKHTACELMETRRVGTINVYLYRKI